MAAAAGRPGGADTGGRPFMSEENAGTEAVPGGVTEVVTGAGVEDADEAEELLVEEISIDGMCGVY
jgi:mycofactocin precursor